MNEGQILWQPPIERVESAGITRFARHVGVDGSYGDLWQWSIEDLGRFWSTFTEWAGVRWTTRPVVALADHTMPGTNWFPDGRLNYAEHALYPLNQVDKDQPAVIFRREDGFETILNWSELRSEVATTQTALANLGVTAGDRVVGLVPNAPEALITMLAAASLGAVWSSCSPEFGIAAVADRFAQTDPTVLIAVDGYYHRGRAYDILGHVQQLKSLLPSIRAAVLIGYLDPAARMDGFISWEELRSTTAERLQFTAVPFDAPLWILYSSGTTGLPKPIVHSHGGILIEHVKQLALHLDLGQHDRFFWFTTTGWMMWNLLVSGLVVGATIVLYDGDPMHPDTDALWRMAQSHAITFFGVSAPYIQACQRNGMMPARFGLDALRSVGSTGAPLTADGFTWVYEAVKPALRV